MATPLSQKRQFGRMLSLISLVIAENNGREG